MRVFVTGATGFIGSAVVRELLDAGHEVLGLARSDQGAAAVAAAGAKVHRGDTRDLDSLRRGAAESDGVIHTAFNHDFSVSRLDASAADRLAVEAMAETLVGTDRPIVIASGTAGLSPGRLATEQTVPESDRVGRHAVEEAAVSFAGRGVRAAVVRFPPTVHGRGDHGFIARLIDIARNKGVSGYPGDGSNRWPAVHRLDAAHLFRLAVESAPAGARLHGVGEEGIPVRDIAEVIGRRLGLPVAAIPSEEAAAHFGFLGAFFALDCPASSALTQRLLGWHPAQPGLVADLETGDYFERRPPRVQIPGPRPYSHSKATR
jgi:nucleoside-diphosphate-sugar epimerase